MSQWGLANSPSYGVGWYKVAVTNAADDALAQVFIRAREGDPTDESKLFDTIRGRAAAALGGVQGSWGSAEAVVTRQDPPSPDVIRDLKADRQARIEGLVSAVENIAAAVRGL